MSEEGRLVAGRYRLLERIGRGGMGTVWRAEDELLGRQVAVKRLHMQPHLQDDELVTLFERTRREARAAARISHPNVVVVHDVVDDEGLPSIVMEYVPSDTLGELLKRNGPLPPDGAARIGRAMLSALRAAHAAGVWHRDVKPGNVLLSETGRIVLTDFGIAQASGTSTLTRTGELIGSIDFLSPERLTGGATPGPEADLWALGATLYQAVEGRSPFRRDTVMETAYAIAQEALQPPQNAGPLGPVIDGLLVRDPAQRLTADRAARMMAGIAAELQTTTMQKPQTARAATGPTAVQAAPGAVPEAVPGAVPESGPGAVPEVVPGAVPESGPGPVPEAVPEAGPGATAVPEVTIRPRQELRRRRPARWIAGMVAAAAVAAGGALAATHLGGRENVAGSHERRYSATPSPRPSPSWTPPKVPAGYRLDHEKGFGFSVPVPRGWSREVVDTGGEVRYVSQNGLVGLRIGVLDFAGPSPLQNWKDIEGQTKAKVDHYKQLRMTDTKWRGQRAAIWEFTFQGRARTWRAIDLGFGAEGGTGYAIYLSAPDLEWVKYLPIFTTAADGFRITQ